ncbi:MAG: sulfotransferase [gamma proteobacterium symbiont of Bathyaustriella thionipta]|nr:sulfotransferase [gamma proteobacterium symbiont of Bathyaustriella thionipta]MCU7951128.1 sulfotransferase [gamma proteobacterium symbiont of Bathyaustriella thionipta]MCU7953916.1 sulfotransferase [gamma proteobacterium symbiont of Bathyaustriella thionipta]MCU7957643.1 sulfotransferase [gamma proteobacterium symbiont of Bathyaustriella thionipta]MCU7967211.1 sulfotransferase [gamma proteobacterium symbiont of Bathyaustriella thionipta]
MYFFICSASYSGSTILDITLGGHDDIVSLGEFSFFNKAIALNQRCSCGTNVVECEQWKVLIEIIKQRYDSDLLAKPYDLIQWDTMAGHVIDANYQTPKYLLEKRFRSFLCDIKYSFKKNSLLDIPLPELLQSGVQNAINLYDLVLEQLDKKHIIDSSKNIHKAVSIYEQQPSKVKIIYLIRDGRGVVNSFLSKGRPRKKSFSAWKKYNLRALKLFKKRVPEDALHIVRYEDFVENTAACVKNICSFLDVEFHPEMLDISRGKRHLVNGNQTMYNRGKGLVADTKWLTELKPADEHYFYKKCGRLNQELGYMPRHL